MQTFPSPDPISVTIDIVGVTRITASDRSDTVVDVRPRDGSKAADINAAQETVVEYADGRLRVQTPKRWTRYTPFGGGESVEVTIEVPTGSDVEGRSDLGDFHVEGELGKCRLRTAMGNLRLDHTGPLNAKTAYGNVAVDHVAGDADISTSSGDVRVGAVDGTALVKNSNGDTDVGDVTGDLHVKASNGDIAVGRARRSVTAKTANGHVRIGEVQRGAVVVETAAGDLAVGVGQGVAAWLDVSTSFGTVLSALERTEAPEGSEETVEVRARTSCGDITISRSPAETTK